MTIDKELLKIIAEMLLEVLGFAIELLFAMWIILASFVTIVHLTS